MTSRKWQKHSPFRATHNRTDNQCGQDAKLTNPVQRKHHPFLFLFSFFLSFSLFTTTTTAKSPPINSRDGSGRSSNQSKSIDCPKGESRLRRGGAGGVVGGGEKVSSSLWKESDMKYGLTSPPRREYGLRYSLPRLTVQEEDEALTFRS